MSGDQDSREVPSTNGVGGAGYRLGCCNGSAWSLWSGWTLLTTVGFAVGMSAGLGVLALFHDYHL